MSWQGRFHIIFAILRQLHLCFSLLRLTWFASTFEQPDIYIVDQLSTCIPFLRWLARTRVIFYCHFPDLLLSPGRAGFDTGLKNQGRRSFLRMVYRWPVDLLEEVTTGALTPVLKEALRADAISLYSTSRPHTRQFAFYSSHVPECFPAGQEAATNHLSWYSVGDFLAKIIIIK